MEEKIKQTKINAISGRILHRRGLKKYENINAIFLILTVIVPLLFITAQYITKGTSAENIVNIVSFILSATLICISILSLIFKITDRIITHKIGIKNNKYIESECDNALHLPSNELNWFFKYVNEIDQLDTETFASITDAQKKQIYREALKELNPGDNTIICPHCKSSPWNYTKGDCQMCGNKITSNKN